MSHPYPPGPPEPHANVPYPAHGYPHYPTPDFYPPKEKGFFGSLFDLNFRSSITLKYTNFVYFLVLFGAGLWVVFGWLFRAFYVMEYNTESGMFWLLLGWIPILFALVIARMTLEYFVAAARTSRDTAEALAVLEEMNERSQS